MLHLLWRALENDIPFYKNFPIVQELYSLYSAEFDRLETCYIILLVMDLYFHKCKTVCKQPTPKFLVTSIMT